MSSITEIILKHDQKALVYESNLTILNQLQEEFDLDEALYNRVDLALKMNMKKIKTDI